MNFLRTLILMAFVFTTGAQELKNPSFEEDIAAIGLPDHWDIPKDTAGQLVTNPVSEGAKAVRFTRGATVISQNLNVKNLAGSKILLSFDAASPDGAKVSVMSGWFVQKPDGKKVWHAPMILSQRVLTGEYTTVSLTAKVQENAVDGRLYLAFQRIAPGTLYLDNIRFRILPPGTDFSENDQKKLLMINRDFRYVQTKVAKLGEKSDTLTQLIAAHAKKIDAVRDGKTLALVEPLDKINAEINRLACADPLPAGWCDAFERLDMAGLTRNPVKSMTYSVLSNEWQALGIEIANPENAVKTVDITLDGFERFADRIELRRQVPLMNFYYREQELTPDALTLLEQDGGKWKLNLEPGERVRLYLGFKVRENGTFHVGVNVGSGKLSGQIVSKGKLPDEKFGNFQFMYSQIQPAGSYPEITARDLAEHYTTGVEYTGAPAAICKPDGSIVSCNFAGHKRGLKAYSDQGIETILFWLPGLKFQVEGTDKFLERQADQPAPSPEFEKAYVGYFRRWAEFVKKEGFAGQMSILPVDEPSSGKDFANPPGNRVRNARRIFELTREADPGFKRYLTGSYYASPEDYAHLNPEVEVILPHWPIPESLTRFAPKDYNPRTTFFEKIYPALKKQKFDIWSYHVDKGKAESVAFERYYPLAVASVGMTGVGTWAYNVYNGTSWDETDGKLDYSFIYCGKDKHPLCQKYNLTGEILIPSIRWEALRMGIQDAKILLTLMKRNPAGLAPILARLQSIAIEQKNFPDQTEINDISRKLREMLEEQK